MFTRSKWKNCAESAPSLTVTSPWRPKQPRRAAEEHTELRPYSGGICCYFDIPFCACLQLLSKRRKKGTSNHKNNKRHLALSQALYIHSTDNELLIASSILDVRFTATLIMPYRGNCDKNFYKTYRELISRRRWYFGISICLCHASVIWLVGWSSPLYVGF